MNSHIKVKSFSGLRRSVRGKFLAGLAIINIAGAIACRIIATKYPEQSFAAALWGMGAVIGLLLISIQSIHLLSPAQNGSRSLMGTAATGVLLLNMAGWMLGLVVSIGAADGPALLQDSQLIAKGIWTWARGLGGLSP